MQMVSAMFKLNSKLNNFMLNFSTIFWDKYKSISYYVSKPEIEVSSIPYTGLAICRKFIMDCRSIALHIFYTHMNNIYYNNNAILDNEQLEQQGVIEKVAMACSSY
jgi:hypothetical protein